MIDRETASDWVGRGARIRVHSGALGHQDHVMAEGTVRGYGDGPMIGIEHDDGRLTWWLTTLPIIEVKVPAVPVPTLTRHAHTRDELNAAVRAAYAFADEMSGYCSPHGVSADYADRLRARLDAVLTAAPKTCAPYFCPASGETECCPKHSGWDTCCSRPDRHRPIDQAGMITAPYLTGGESQ